MFEKYLEDAKYFFDIANNDPDNNYKCRYYRASIFCSIAAIESFVNYLGDMFLQGETLPDYELAFINDEKYEFDVEKFKIVKKTEFHSLEAKLRYLIKKYLPGFDFNKQICWSRLLDLKQFRDKLIHPRQDDYDITNKKYETTFVHGFNSIIELMDILLKAILKKGLRQKLLDLSIN